MRSFARKQDRVPRSTLPAGRAPAPARAPRPQAEALEAPGRFGHDFGRVAVHGRTAPRMQARLAVSAPGDAYEREAEQVAGRVMRMAAPARPAGGEGRDPSGRAGEAAGASGAPPLVREALASTGQPLDAGTRAFMEARFGHDFGQVRVHADARAARSARAVDALAYTVGRDIVFAPGAYAPASAAGRHLLAHELAHVVQQSPAAGGASGGAALSATPAPMIQRQTTGAFAALTLSAISCLVPDDYGGDEVYIKVNGTQVWGPVSMDTGSTHQLSHRTHFSGPITIEVYDQESWPMSDDLIGSVTISSPTSEEEIRRDPGRASLTNKGAYQLFYQVHRV